MTTPIKLAPKVYRYDVIHPVTKRPCKQPLMGYRFPEETMSELLKNNRVLFGNDHTKLIELKIYLRDYRQKLPSIISLDGRAGPNQLKEIFSDVTKVFNNPKPVELLQNLLSFVTKPGDLVLDFFAGSGTTANAVQKLNQEDGGNRRFILVSSTEATHDAPDKNLCRDVCAERVRRVLRGYTNKKGETVEGLGGDFAYLRTRRIPADAVLSRIEHEQVWTALQLIHTQTLQPFQQGKALQTAELADGRLIYCPKISEETPAQLQALAGGQGQTLVYSWQPGWLSQHLPDEGIAIEPIPAFLINRFGGNYAA